LASLFRRIAADPCDLDGWKAILSWSFRILAPPKRGGKRHNLANIIKKRVSNFSAVDCSFNAESSVARLPDSSTSRLSSCLADAISAKLEDGNIRAAVRLLCSDDRVAAASPETLSSLVAKHPSASVDRKPFPPPLPSAALSVDESDVLGACRSFPAGSSGGPDGFRPQHLLDLVNCTESGSDFLTALTGLVNLLLGGSCHQDIIPILFGGRLLALEKKSGGIRPIAVGYTIRRLVAKCANKFAISKMVSSLCPRQLGVGVPGGCEAAIHATRRFIDSMQAGSVVTKLDFSNAFNCLHRDSMLQAVHDKIPELYNFCHLSYSCTSLLSFGSHTVLSQEGPQQGDPLGPFLFCLTVQPLLDSLSSNLSIGFLDDFTLGGHETVVADDVNTIIESGEMLGLNLNTNKCELICEQQDQLESDLLRSFFRIQPDDSYLLGAPLFPGQALDSALASCCSALSLAIDRLGSVGSHDALILLRASLSAPKVLHTLRCAPCVDHPSLHKFDELLRSGISRITNSDLGDDHWTQASLPVGDGGLGVRKIASLAIPAYLASAASTCDLQNQILSRSNCPSDPFVDDFSCQWSAQFNLPPLVPPLSLKQSAWDRPGILAEKQILTSCAHDRYNQARLFAVSAPHSGDWLHALPISACGLRLDNEAVRVAVGLRLGLNLCVPHECPCGALVDARGIHGLSCRLGCGRIARHSLLNDAIWRAFTKAGIPASKEPSGLVRTDGKRPDGVSLIPWRSGKPVTWDVTVIDTLAESYSATASATPGGVAELAAERKLEKYSCLPNSYDFQPLAFETLGPINSTAISFISELGRRIEQVTGDRRETVYFFQRLSVAVQRFNAVAFNGSFLRPADSDK